MRNLTNIQIVNPSTLNCKGLEHYLLKLNPSLALSIYNRPGEIESATVDPSADILLLSDRIAADKLLDLVAAAQALKAPVKVLMLISDNNISLSLDYLKMNIEGIVTELVTADELADAVCSILSDEKYIIKDVQKELLSYLLKASPPTPKARVLSRRQQQIADLLSKGYSTKQIAAELELKSSSVSTMKSKLFKHLGVSNVIELNTKLNESKK